MKLLLASVLFLISISAYAIDVGDGSDGVCRITGGGDTQITAARKFYQCTYLHLDGNLSVFNGAGAGAGGSALVIKVKYDVYSTGFTISLNGSPGVEGDTSSGKTGGAAGAGGGAGGSSPGLGVDGSNGGNSGGGIGGLFVTPFANSSYGGGGGGGSFKTQGASAGIDGDSVGGATPTSGGANGVAFGNEATFDSTFTGGSGGGAGGGGKDSGVFKSGSSGGGGGGAIRIVAGGDILNLDVTINANGGNGGGLGSTTFSGGGGGGSGGAIFIQAGGNLTLGGSIFSAIGGAVGQNDLGSGFGGAGGDGIIRLDDSDGVVPVGGATITPAKSSFTFKPTALTSGDSAMRAYASDISCASVVLDDQNKPYNNLINLLIGVVAASLLHLFISGRSKV